MVPDIPKLLQLVEEAVSQEVKEAEHIISYLKECRQMGVEVLPLDINMSDTSCSIEDDKRIRIGFSLLASGNEQFLEDIIAERQQNGQFRSLQDFCERINIESVPPGFITQCIQVGAFDSLESSRSRLFFGQERIIQAVRKTNAEKASGQFSLFGTQASSNKQSTSIIELPETETWNEEEIIAHEKEAAGFSFTEYLFSTSPEMDIEEIENGAKNLENPPTTFVIQLATMKTTEQILLQLRNIIEKHPGNSKVWLEFVDNKGRKTCVHTHADYSLQVSEKLIKEIETITGEKTIWIQHAIEQP